ncbi:MAG: zinc-dependent alcohol dehydrogenase family protein [Verrucomicrobia bacterium]|nr:zinc-dependent alcohol dehydrogenase family protein [Verrucomicrobiota bacterium]MBV9642741.1 zinc-dependent alcohol dehydrogenase family protein [Verrucomicrobiota bacterium]
MKAAILNEMGRSRPYANSKPLVVEEVDLDPPGPGELLVKIKATGLCHSDLSVINGDRPRPMPMILGHEAAGEVVECGPGISDLKPDDQVVMAFVPSCGSCLPCMEGRPALCEPGARANGAGTLLSGARRLQFHKKPINHHIGVSGYAEYAVVSRRSAIKVDASLPAHEAALFGCAVLTGVGAVVNTAKVPAGCSVAVVGLGGVGLSAVMAANLVGAAEIIAIDTVQEKLEVASRLGATRTVKAGPDAIKEVRDLTEGGVDFALEMASSVPALQLAFDITRRGGTTVTASLPHPDHRFFFPAVVLAAEERILKGSYLGSCVPVRDIPRYISLYQRGKLPVDKLLSEIVSLEELNEAFDRLADARSIRQVMTFY